MAEPTQYQGLDVLEVEPNRLATLEDALERRFNLLDSLTGGRWPDELEAAPATVRPFVWTAINRAEANHMRSFIDARKGRAVPFWLPSWQQDLTLASDALLDQTILEINWIRYSSLMFPDVAARRHLAIMALGEDPSYHWIDEATDPGDEIVESITIDPGAPRALPAASTILSFLRYCRLEEDEVSWVWESSQVCHALIKVREIPKEAPYVL